MEDGVCIVTPFQGKSADQFPALAFAGRWCALRMYMPAAATVANANNVLKGCQGMPRQPTCIMKFLMLRWKMVSV